MLGFSFTPKAVQCRYSSIWLRCSQLHPAFCRTTILPFLVEIFTVEDISVTVGVEVSLERRHLVNKPFVKPPHRNPCYFVWIFSGFCQVWSQASWCHCGLWKHFSLASPGWAGDFPCLSNQRMETQRCWTPGRRASAQEMFRELCAERVVFPN